MKIAYYLPSLQAPGGLERIITSKANYFAEHFDGYEVYIITSDQSGQPIHFPLSPKVKHIDLDVSFDWPFSQSRIGKLVKYPFRYRKFRSRFTRLLEEIRPDITISTLRRELNFVNSLKDGSVKIGEFHTSRYFYHAESLHSKNPILNQIKKNLVSSFVQNLNKLTKFIILTHEGSLDWPELRNLTVIPNPITIPAGHSSDVSSRQVIAVGRYSYEKAFDRLIEAWEIITKRHPDWILRIYGEGMRKELQQQIDQAGIKQTCVLEHAVPDIVNKYCESSIFVLSSRFEGLPLVLGEAMLCGVPPVAFACPYGPKDMITDGKDGLLVENGNIEQLADRICYLIENEDIRKEMSKQAKIRAKDFEMEHIAQLWKKLFEEITNQ